MKNLLFLFFISFVSIYSQVVEIKGKILDNETKNPLSSANIYLLEKHTGSVSDREGNFIINELLSNEDLIRISYVGYKTLIIKFSELEFLPKTSDNKILIYLSREIISSQTVLVEGSIGVSGDKPISFTTLNRKEISENYTVQDIPEFLGTVPSVSFYSESGNGIGYNYISIRGFDQRRISVSINGIPQNDPEDHNVYWLDFADLLGSSELIQVQRGAGAGVIGYPAIGGSINIITSSFSDKPFVNALASFGSYNTRKYSASFSSGLINNKYSVSAKLSQTLSSGYRNNSWAELNSYHFSAVRFDENFTTQINFYGGPISDGLAYSGLPKFAIKDRDLRKLNLTYWETDNNKFVDGSLQHRRPQEIENFSQPHYELLNEWNINKNVTFNSALFLILGKGFFDFDGSWGWAEYFRLTPENGFSADSDPQNVIIKAFVDNKQYGWIPRFNIKHKNGNLIIGGEIRKHNSLHWGAISHGENLPTGVTALYRYYEYKGGKDILNFFVQENFSLNEKISLVGEVQLAYSKYKFYDEKYVNTNFDISNFFINTRTGINYKFNNEISSYLSFAKVSREPRLKNYYDAAESSGGAIPQFETYINGNYDFNKPLVKPETMYNFEIGSVFNSDNLLLNANLYFMFFNDEIIRSGQLDRFGQPVTGNVEQTIHQGIELSAVYKFKSNFEIITNGTFGSNKINNGKAFVRWRNSGGTRVVSEVDLSGNKIGGFPDFLANVILKYKNNDLMMQISGRYSGEFFTDNYDKNINKYLNSFPGFVSYSDNINDAYFSVNFYGSYEFSLFNSLNKSKIFLQVNNLFDSLYSAYGAGGEFFPAAERHFLTGIQIGL